METEMGRTRTGTRTTVIASESTAGFQRRKAPVKHRYAMKASKIFPTIQNSNLARHTAKGCVAALLVALVAISLDTTIGLAQQPGGDVPGAEVLTRGPVHEAFAGMVTYNPEPGVVVAKAPPELIEEMPPEERPEGDNVTWIPGYWAWDDERSDFLWVSGTWRALPPGREWMAGYWGRTTQGYQWTSGYWADATARETTYLPPPPATVEVGPNIAAPSVDYGWTPGCWIWYEGRYAWRPGYWVQGRADWDWCPSYYVWTPHGYIFVGGFWDYPVARRGVLFAPVYFGAYSQHGYRYSPSIAISVGVFSDHLFLRPSYHHYYFGDYYAASYVQIGFYSSFSYQSGRHGYDPIYSHQHWEHRQDREWEHRVETTYQYRRDHEAARPPRTWVAQRSVNPSTPEAKQNRLVVAAPLAQLAKSKEAPMRLQPVATAERQKLAQRGQEVQKSREERRTVESKPAATAVPKPGGAIEPARVNHPQSPIVSKAPNQLGRNHTPPKAPQAPKPDPKVQPKSQPPGRQPSVERSSPQSEPRRPEPEKKPAPERNEAPPKDKQVQAEPEPRRNEAASVAQEKARAAATELAGKSQSEPEPRAKAPGQGVQAEPGNDNKDLQRKQPVALEPRSGQSEAKTSAESPRPVKKQTPAVKRGAKDPKLTHPERKPEQPAAEKPVEPTQPSKN